MLVGNRWVENAYLKLLNVSGIVAGNWVTLVGHIQTGLTEKGFLKGLSVAGGSAAGSVVGVNVLVDGNPIHQGHFQAYLTPGFVEKGNQQPALMVMPELDIPEDSQVELSVRMIAGGAVALFFDLAMIAYEVRAWEQAVQPVCYVEDVVGRQRESG